MSCIAALVDLKTVISLAPNQTYTLRSSINSRYAILVSIGLDNLYPLVAIRDQATGFKQSVKRRGQCATPIEPISTGDLNSTLSDSHHLCVSTGE